jgi:hypothetical protein
MNKHSNTNSYASALPRGASNTRNYHTAVAISSQDANQQLQPIQQRHIRRLPKRAENFSQQSQKSYSSARFSTCSSAGISQAFHQTDGDEDDLSKYAFSMDGSVLWRKSYASSCETGSQYSLTDDEEGSVYVDLSGYFDEEMYKDSIPSQEELERIYLEMRAIRLAEDEELRKALEASEKEQKVNLEFRGEEKTERNYGTICIPVHGKFTESVDTTDQSSYSEAEGAPSNKETTPPIEKKKKWSFLRRLRHFFFSFGRKQDKVQRAIANANRQQARMTAKRNKRMDQYMGASAPVRKANEMTNLSSKQDNVKMRQQQQMRQSAPATTMTHRPTQPQPLDISMAPCTPHGYSSLLISTEVEC